MNVSKKGLLKRASALAACMLIMLLLALPAFAAGDSSSSEAAVTEEAAENGDIGLKALGAGICVGIAAFGGVIGMGLASSKAEESIARQPEATGDIRGSMMLGFVFMETGIIYALIVAILIIFVM